MKQGDLVRATWTDGLVLTGRYVGTERGYIILKGDAGEQIVCDANIVTFEVLESFE